MWSGEMPKVQANKKAVAALLLAIYASLPVFAGVGVFLCANALLLFYLTTFEIGSSEQRFRAKLRLGEMNSPARIRWMLTNVVFFALSIYIVSTANTRLLDLL